MTLSILFTLLGACAADGSFDIGQGGNGTDVESKSVDNDGDGHNAEAYGGDDCDDANAAKYPGALEVCDSVDNDCDGDVDDNDTSSIGMRFGADFDGDLYVDSIAIIVACDMHNYDEMLEKLDVDTAELDNWIEIPTYQYDSSGTLAYPDCDDDEATTYPGATEVCDTVDNDCDVAVDEDTGAPTTWYADSDGDTYGDALSTMSECTQPSGYVSNDDDCNDANAAIKPTATEMCDTIDNNCDGTTDGSDSADAATWYYDQDVDGYGVTTSTIVACTVPTGYAALSTDCDDTDDTAYPGATEVCDSVDNDCNSSVDDGAGAPITWYEDTDGDLYGDSAYSATTCDAPAGYVETSGDCDDTNAAVNPLATEVSNGYDDDCDTLIDEGVTCASEVDVIYSQGDAITITADATDNTFDGAWWNGTTSGVTGVAATEASLGGDYREYTFTFDMCFVSGTTQLNMTGTFDLGGDLCKVDGTGAILRAYEDGTRLTVTSTLDGMGGCYYAVTE